MILHSISVARESNKKQIALLIDPDKADRAQLIHLLKVAELSDVDFIFYGGSLVTENGFEEGLSIIKDHTNLPVVLFPGSSMQFSGKADAILFMSLISGRNPDLLIGQQVQAAAKVSASNIEVLPTGYMLIEGGRLTTAHYISNTLPIPANKPEVAVSTAMAGKLLGLKLIYMDAGSGANYPISEKMITAVSNQVQLPLIIGGGLRNVEAIRKSLNAGADVVVVGTAAEKDPTYLMELSDEVKSFACK